MLRGRYQHAENDRIGGSVRRAEATGHPLILEALGEEGCPSLATRDGNVFGQ